MFMFDEDYEIEERINSERILSSDSRYLSLDILKDSEGEYFLETWKDIGIKESDLDNFHEVKKREENRLDLIANKYYRNHTFWWVIALANDIKNPFDIEVGDILRIPSLSTIYGYEGVFE